MTAKRLLVTDRPPPFSARFAYLRFLKHLALGHAPSNRAIGEAAGVTGEAVTGWIKRDAPPPDYDVVKALLRYFAVEDRAEWFRKGQGEPPEPALWERWLAERTGRSRLSTEVVHATPAELAERSHPEPVAKKRRRGQSG